MKRQRRAGVGLAVGEKSYLLNVLLLISASNFVDRLLLGLVLQDIKVDLSLSDTQLGFLTGIAFALFYSIMGIPIARWADRGNRVLIIAVTTALWSVAMAMSGVAGNFQQLLLIRVLVAVGEAGCMPPAHSLIAEVFTRAERPRAVAHYMLGGPLAYVIGYFVGGWLNQLFGWRATFMMLGFPGLGLAVLAWFTLRDPRVGNAAPTPSSTTEAFAEASSASEQPGLKEVCVTLWANATFRHLVLAYSVLCFFGSGIGSWKAPFFIRSFGLQTGELGVWLAIIWGGGGILGTYWGGLLADRHAARNERLQLKAMAAVYVSFVLVSSGVYLSSNVFLAFGLMAISLIGVYTVVGPLFAVIQTIVHERMRAMSIAIVGLFANLIGMGLGPLAVGALSDAIRPWTGEESLRYALLAMCPGYWWVAWHLWRASKTVESDLIAVPR
jgi:predicted MFS family arabinose efflux permease